MTSAKSTISRTSDAQKVDDLKVNKQQYPTDYMVVPKPYRDKVHRRNLNRNFHPVEPMVKDLIAGKTLVIDAHVPLGANKLPYRNLYSTLAARGYRVRMYVIDDIDLDLYRAVIIWAEALTKLWSCSRCGDFEISSEQTKPQTQGCESVYTFHSWREINRMNKATARDRIPKPSHYMEVVQR